MDTPNPNPLSLYPTRGDDAIVIQPKGFATSLPKKQRRSTEDPLSLLLMPPPSTPSSIPFDPARVFFKTRLCLRFKMGGCPLESRCTYAHGMEELRRPLLPAQQTCRMFSSGRGCSYGDRCAFVHVGSEKAAGSSIGSGLRRTESVVVAGSSGQCDRSKWKETLVKTGICCNWESTGGCRFGERCRFAHGSAERNIRAQMELDGMNVERASSKPCLSRISDLSPSKMESTSSHQAQPKKCSIKWSRHNKISHIYADWIDDIPLLPYTSPTKTRT